MDLGIMTSSRENIIILNDSKSLVFHSLSLNSVFSFYLSIENWAQSSVSVFEHFC